MSVYAAQIVAIFTFLLLEAIIAVSVGRSFFFPPPQLVRGVSVSGFTRYDLVVVTVITLFFSIAPLTQFLSKTPSPSGAVNIGGLAMFALIEIMLVIPVVVRLRELHVFKSPPKDQVELWKVAFYVLGSVLLTFYCAFLVVKTGLDQWIMRETGAEALQTSVKSMMTSPVSIRVCMALSAVFVAPIVEEICFRGYLYPICKRYTGAVFAAIATSLLFSVIHMSLVQTIPLFVMGLLLVISYERTKNLWVPIAIHMVFNGMSVVNILFDSNRQLP